ncbi:hypothetical protein CGC20_32085 [Leishmania donovani]|uniref:Uncharacterized protein n=1 Tax=Leishmania donovani TaxID=5661 RepID=A0A504XC90_LEIDO|nr:hypothetical protein CGC20_32085 [Leishmania donovani]
MSLIFSTTSPPPVEVAADDSRWDALAAECQRCSASLYKCKQEAERIVQSMDGVLFCAALEATPPSVCGAAADPGRAILETLLEHGCAAFLANVDGASVASLRDELDNHGAAAERVSNALGRVYILVCHAGINIMEALESTTLDSACCAREDAAPLMRASLALELIPFNTCVSVRHLGTGNTPMGEHLTPATHQQPENLGKALPIGRLQHPHAVYARCYPVLQRRRLGVSLHYSDRQQGGVHRNSAEARFTPPPLLYHTDFAETYCGFDRQRVGYTRPLAERSIIRVEGDREVCCKSADTFLLAHYAPPPYPAADAPRQCSRGARATADSFATLYHRNGINADTIRIAPMAVVMHEYGWARYVGEPTVRRARCSDSFDSSPNLTVEQRLRLYAFFSDFMWKDRKGWDVLLGRRALAINTKFEAALTRGLMHGGILRFIEATDMAQMRANTDAFAYRYDEGMAMAVPSSERTAELMQDVVQHPGHAQHVGRRARELVRELGRVAVTDRMGQPLRQQCAGESAPKTLALRCAPAETDNGAEVLCTMAALSW